MTYKSLGCTGKLRDKTHFLEKRSETYMYTCLRWNSMTGCASNVLPCS